MKIAIIICLFVISYSSSSQNRKNPVIDVQQYIFNIELTDEDDTIRCAATLRIKFVENTANITVDLASLRNDGKGMKVLAVTENKKSLSFTHANNLIRITLQTTAKRDEEKMFEIFYLGIPADGLIISKNKYKQRTFFADNWPDRGRHWLACVDHPSDKAGVDFIVKAPVHYQVIANGTQVEETNLTNNIKLTHWRETVPLPTKIMVIGVADFAVKHAGNVDCIPVTSWVYPEDRVNGFYDYEQAIEILPFFIKNVGPYPYKKLANVQSKTIFGGMENAAAIFYSENSVTGKRELESLLAHEIAHQWFGNMATEKDWPHVWLSEGFATYMTNLYMENKYGLDTLLKMLDAQKREVITYAKRNLKPIVDTTVSDYMKLLNPNSYQKGGWVLHMLRRKIGDSIFWKGIRNYYSAYAGKNASTDDLRKIMEETSRQDLKDFFYQWVFSPGHPVLNIGWKYDTNRKSLIVHIEQQQQHLFQFPLEFVIYGVGNNGMLTKSIRVKDKTSSFYFPMSAKPQKIVVDPNVSLLFESSLKEIK